MSPKHILPPMVFFTWDIHYECNYGCTYCFLNFEPQTKNIKTIYLKPEEWFKIWKNIFDKYGSCHISITGGEPFTYPNFIDLISLITDLHTVEICTNLSFDIKEFIQKLNPTRIKLDASYHPEFINIEEFIDKINLLKDRNFEVSHVVIVAYPPLLDKINEYKEKFELNGIKIVVYPYRGPYKERMFPSEYSDLEREILKKYGLTFADINKRLFDTLVDRKIKEEYKEILCRMGQMYAKIVPNGNAYRCCAAVGKDWGYVGNLLDNKFHLYEDPLVCSNLKDCVCFKSMIIGQEDKWIKSWPYFLNSARRCIDEGINKAENYYNQGKIDEAIDELNKNLELDQTNIKTIIKIIELYILTKQYYNAQKFLMKLIQIAPYMSNSNDFKSSIYLYIKENNYDSALQYLKNILTSYEYKYK